MSRGAVAEGELSGPQAEEIFATRVSRRIEQRAEAEPSPATLHNLALLQLSQGRYDEAILTLESVLALSSPEAGPASDLAAAYLTRAEAQDRAFDLVLALGSAQRALEADPHLPQALFNRALILTRLSLRHRAIAAWEAFLRTDPSPVWEVEARRRLAELGRPTLDEEWEVEWPRLEKAALRGNFEAVRSLVARFPNPARLKAEEKLLPEWASARERGDLTQAAAKLTEVRRIGAALLEVANDAMVLSSVASIDRAVAERDEARLVSLISGHGTYGRGLTLYRAQELDRALPVLEESVRELRAAGSPLANSAELYVIICLHYADSSRAAHELASLREDIDGRRYPILAGFTEWMLGTVENNQGRPEHALGHFKVTRELLEASLGPQGVAYVHVLKAETLQRLGETEEAWRERLAALQNTGRLGDRRWLHGALYEPAYSLVEQGTPSLALDFLEELLANNRAWGNTGALTEAHLLRGRAFDLLGRSGEALGSFHAAQAQTVKIGAGPLRDRVAAALALAEGEGLVVTDPAQAITRLTAALESHLKQGFFFEITRVLTARARAYLALGDSEQAEGDLEQAISEYERVRDGVHDERLRLSYFEQAQEVFDEMITLQADRSEDGAVAFDYAEKARSRFLLDITFSSPVKGRLPRALPSHSISDRLPRGVVLVELAMLSDRVLAWVIVPGSGSLSPVTIQATPGDLARRIRLLQMAVERQTGEKELRDAASTLFDDLIRPLLPHLPASANLVFVPDRSLAQVPFSALFDARRGRYLIEDYTIAVAPSATLYITTVERRLSFPRGGSWNALAIGDPAFDPSLHPRLIRLPEAAKEALEVAAFHSGSESLRGQAATRNAFLAAAGRHRLIHFAGHAILDPFLPRRSRLVLASSREEGGDALYAHELAGLKFEATELVVLSACQTVGSTPNSREALTGLATAFLATGPPVVVASLWDVEDRAARELMRAFHRALRQDGEPAAALRTAQLQLLQSRDPAQRSPASWAGFVAIGGSFPTIPPSGEN